MSNWQTQPDAPESVKYHGGYDPADPPFDPEAARDEIFCAECSVCGEPSNPDECDKEGRCPNCQPLDCAPRTNTAPVEANHTNGTGDTWVDENGTVWTPPTAWAYAMVCKARDKYSELAARTCVIQKVIDVLGPMSLIPTKDLIALRAQGSGSPRSAASTPAPSGEALRNRGLARVLGNNKAWMQKAIAHFIPYFNQATFTGEDIRLWLEDLSMKPNHPNATGALIAALVRKGLIVHTGEYRTPKDKASHARKQKVYKRA